MIKDNNKFAITELVSLLDMYGDEEVAIAYTQSLQYKLAQAGLEWLEEYK